MSKNVSLRFILCDATPNGSQEPINDGCFTLGKVRAYYETSPLVIGSEVPFYESLTLEFVIILFL